MLSMPSRADTGDPDNTSEAGRILFGVFETLDRAGVRYCVLHGYEAYPQRVQSDVDCLVDPRTTPGRLLALLHRHRTRIGAKVVRCRGYHIVLAGEEADGSACFVTLDFTVDCNLDGLLFYRGTEVLQGRRRCGQFWIPAPHLDFACYLARTIKKGCLDDKRGGRLCRLYEEDAAGCEQQVKRLWWGIHNRELVLSACKSGVWEPLRQELGDVRAELIKRTIMRHPAPFLCNVLGSLVRRIGRAMRPDGLNVVLLGPDGAGKSSVIKILGPQLGQPFVRWRCWGFAPPLLSVLRGRQPRDTSRPHALPPRSYLTSLARGAYWLGYYTFSHFSLRLVLARTTLVLHDRHFVDIFVDPKRYRYGGPSWLLQVIWRAVPKPDLVILLDAQSDVLQGRKQEVSSAERSRQRKAYIALVQRLENGHIIDATQSLECVVKTVSCIILHHLSGRIVSRFGLERHTGRSGTGERLHAPSRGARSA